MIFLMIAAAMAIYFLIAICCLIWIFKETPSRSIRVGAIVFFVMMPSWDAVIGVALYWPMSRYWSGINVYKTINTDEYCYENNGNILLSRKITYTEQKKDNDNFVSGHTVDAFRHGFKTIEIRVNGRYESNQEVYFGYFQYFRCAIDRQALNNDPIHIWTSMMQNMTCSEIPSCTSNIVVRRNRWPVGTLQIETVTILDAARDETLGEYKGVALRAPIPFFNWLNWKKLIFPGKPEIIARHPDTGAYEFEFRVLNPKL